VLQGRVKRLGIEKVDSEPVVGSEWEERLIALGFRSGPRKLTIG
jgi:ATP-dependent Lhr-like helicase